MRIPLLRWSMSITAIVIGAALAGCGGTSANAPPADEGAEPEDAPTERDPIQEALDACDEAAIVVDLDPAHPVCESGENGGLPCPPDELFEIAETEHEGERVGDSIILCGSARGRVRVRWRPATPGAQLGGWSGWGPECEYDEDGPFPLQHCYDGRESWAECMVQFELPPTGRFRTRLAPPWIVDPVVTLEEVVILEESGAGSRGRRREGGNLPR